MKPVNEPFPPFYTERDYNHFRLALIRNVIVVAVIYAAGYLAYRIWN